MVVAPVAEKSATDKSATEKSAATEKDIFDFSSKKDWAQKLIEKCKKAFEKEETRKLIQVFLVDPVIQYVIGRIFPYIIILCVLFILLTVATFATLLIVFTGQHRS